MGRAAFVFAWDHAHRQVVTLLGLDVVLGVLPVVAGWCGKLVLDELVRGQAADVARVVLFVAVGAASAALMPVFTALSGHTSAILRGRLGVAADTAMIAALHRSPGIARLEDPAMFDQIQLADQAAQSAPAATLETFSDGVQNLVRILGFVGLLLTVWSPIAVVLLVVTVPEVVMRLAASRRDVEQREALAPITRLRFRHRSLITDARSGREIRAFGFGSWVGQRTVDLLHRVVTAEIRISRRAAVVAVGSSLLGTLVTVVGSIAASLSVVSGSLSVGDYGLFLAAVGGTQSALSGLARLLGAAREELALYENFRSVTTAPPDLEDGLASPEPLRSEIEFRDVWFRYGPGLPWVLRGVSFTIPARSFTGIVGLNGAGKSTVVKLLCRFYDPVRGAVLWDGTDIRDLRIGELRDRISVAFQDYVAYDLTAHENIALGDLARATPLRVCEAARLAGVGETLAALPQGYDTLLSRIFLSDDTGDEGVLLSGGQWQKVALARSLIRDRAELLILDEPTSALDPAAEDELQSRLAELRRGRTSLSISHRLGHLRSADQIVVLDDGVVVDCGDHDELIARGGRYAEFFAMQARGYTDRATT